MEISWIGHSSIRIRGREATVIVDPWDKKTFGTMSRPKAHLILNSRSGDPLSSGNDQVAPAGNQTPIIFDRPGEYEISGVQVEGYKTSESTVKTEADSEPIQAVAGGTSWLIKLEGISIGILSGLKHALPTTGKGLFANADVILCPIGLAEAIPQEIMVKTVREINPSVVIPYGYDSEEDENLTAFVGAFGSSVSDPVDSLTIAGKDVGPDISLQIHYLQSKLS